MNRSDTETYTQDTSGFRGTEAPSQGTSAKCPELKKKKVKRRHKNTPRALALMEDMKKDRKKTTRPETVIIHPALGPNLRGRCQDT